MGLKYAMITAAAIAGLASAAVSSVPSLMTDMRHTSWTEADGAPISGMALAQGADGFIWIGSQDGLFRFDGVTFEQVPPPQGQAEEATSVRALFTDKLGNIWAGYTGYGGVAVFHNGKLTQMHIPRPAREVTKIVEDFDDTIWVVGARADHALTRYIRGRWAPLDASWHMPNGFVFDALVGLDGTLWVVTEDHLVFLPKGSHAFRTSNIPIQSGASLAQDGHGRVWLVDRNRAQTIFSQASGGSDGEKVLLRHVDDAPGVDIALFDGSSRLWLSRQTHGIMRFGSSGLSDPARFDAEHGLSADGVRAMIRDKEGDIWTASELGIDRFRPARITFLNPPDIGSTIGYYLATDGRGAMYLTDDVRSYFFGHNQAPRTLKWSPAALQAVCSGLSGSVWFLGTKTMVRLTKGKPGRRVIVPPSRIVTSCTEDLRGHVWLARYEGGLTEFDGRHWSNISLPPSSGRPQEVVADPSGGVIVNLERKRVLQIANGVTTRFDAKALGIGFISQIYAESKGWIGIGPLGLARVRGNRISKLSSKCYPFLQNGRDLRQTPGGSTWILTGRGVVHLESEALDRAFDHPGQPLPYRLFDQEDGLTSVPQRLNGPQMVTDARGRLWVLSRQGVAFMDARAIPRNQVAPPITIRSLMANGHTYVDPTQITLPKGTRRFSIDYAALSLAMPDRVQFQYRLDGAETAWVDPGSRREAFYTNLGPGQYRFRVIAANADGVWNQTGATLDITIPPTFLQTRLFVVLCMVGAGAFLWLVYTLRLKAVAARVRSRMAERLKERERIARELHDTLLQSVQALILQLHVIAKTVPPGDASQERIMKTLRYADTVLLEGRDRVHEIRSSAAVADVASAIIGFANATGLAGGLEIRSSSVGRPRRVTPSVMDETLKVAGEAVFNALRHAHATRLDVLVSFKSNLFTIAIRDDGVGIADTILQAGEKQGHFGLAGMRERASRIGGRLTVGTERGGGTVITLHVPASIAYPRSGLPVPSWLRRLHPRHGMV